MHNAHYLRARKLTSDPDKTKLQMHTSELLFTGTPLCIDTLAQMPLHMPTGAMCAGAQRSTSQDNKRFVDPCHLPYPSVNPHGMQACVHTLIDACASMHVCKHEQTHKRIHTLSTPDFVQTLLVHVGACAHTCICK